MTAFVIFVCAVIVMELCGRLSCLAKGGRPCWAPAPEAAHALFNVATLAWGVYVLASN